jgi:dihydroxyacetone kinase-like protein
MAARNCREATFHAAVATTPMIARKGRASYLGERSAGFQDPGATSAALLFDALAQAIATSPAPRVMPSASPQPILASP